MLKTSLDIVWLLMASGLVFLMQAGFAMVESGLTRSKNNINVAIKNLSDFGISLLCFWFVGFGLMFGQSIAGLFGSSLLFPETTNMWTLSFILFQAMFCSTAATIVSGAVAERMRFISYLVSTVAMSIIVYPIFGHWAWGGGLEGSPSGWLAKLGFVDFAGSSVVHSLGGWVSLAAIIVIGPRVGRFDEKGKAKQINGASIPMAVLGVLLLWFGWIGFNGGSTLGATDAVPGIILNTMLGGGAGMIAALLVGWPLKKYPDISLVINGSLAGLVAITANCHAVTPNQAILIGAIGGVIMIFVSELLVKLRIDDAVDAIPVHLGAGIWGTLAVALFGDPAKLNTGLDFWGQVGAQALGIAVCGAWGFGISFVGLFILNKIRPIRITKQEEHEGLNVSEHKVSTEIHDLFEVMNYQSKTGDLSLRAPVEPFTEAGQIASLYNSVLEGLESHTVEKSDYLDILDNVSDGLCTIDQAGNLGTYYSQSLSKILFNKDLQGANLIKILEPLIDSLHHKSLSEFISMAFDNSMAWRHLEKLNPLKEVEVFFDDGEGGFTKKTLRTFFTRINKEGKVDKLLVLLRDVSRESMMEAELEKARREGQQEIEMLNRLIHLDGRTLAEFLADFKTHTSAINEILRSGGENLEQSLQRIFSISHRLKGDAELLGLSFIVESAEAIEVKAQEVLRKQRIEAEDFLPLTLSCSDLIKLGDKLSALLAKWTNLGTSLNANYKLGALQLEDSLQTMVERLSNKYQKEIKLRFEGDSQGLSGLEDYKKIRDIVVQLVRNAIYHGIELPSDRKAKNKAESGTIKITVDLGAKNLSLKVTDDGTGIDPAELKKSLVAKKILTEEDAQKASDKTILTYIFAQGLSTAKNPDSLAGKGVGLALVEKLVKEMGGRISLKTSLGHGTEFGIHLPLGGN